MDDEHSKLSDSDIRAEIERQMGCTVDFRAEPVYLHHKGQWVTEVRFSAEGYGVAVCLDDKDRAMPLEKFGARIVAPMVQRWRVAVRGRE